MILALFDFDGTLTKRDTFVPFTMFVVGKIGFIGKVSFLLPTLIKYKFGFLDNNLTKKKWIEVFFKGLSEEYLLDKGERFAKKYLPSMLDKKVFNRLLWHKRSNHRVIIVSASLEVYLKPFAEQIGVEAIGTKLEFRNGVATGNIDGKNCYGIEKVNRLKAVCNLSEYDKIYAYGDSKGDEAIFSIADEVFKK